MPEETIMHDGMTVQHLGNTEFEHYVSSMPMQDDIYYDELTEEFLIEAEVGEKIEIQIAEERIMAVYDQTILYSVTILGKQRITVESNNDEGKFLYEAKLRMGKDGDASRPFHSIFHNSCGDEYRLRWRYKRWPAGEGYSEWSDVFTRSCDCGDDVPGWPPFID